MAGQKVLALVNGEQVEIEISGGGGSVPYFIASDNTFSVPELSQALYTALIDVEGVLSVDGILVEVN